MDSTMTTTRSMVIQAERARVWQAITDAAQISQWFDGSMGWEFKPAAGEPITFRYNGEIIGTGKVVMANPPERFAFQWTPEAGNPTLSLVTFVLEAVAEGTRVTITEAGFEALPDAVRQKRYEMNGMGWGIALDHLTAYLQAADHD